MFQLIVLNNAYIQQFLTLEKIVFDLPDSPESYCDYDYIEVHDGGDRWATVIGRYCNGYGPPDIIQAKYFINHLS